MSNYHFQSRIPPGKQGRVGQMTSVECYRAQLLKDCWTKGELTGASRTLPISPQILNKMGRLGLDHGPFLGV